MQSRIGPIVEKKNIYIIIIFFFTRKKIIMRKTQKSLKKISCSRKMSMTVDKVYGTSDFIS